jgi:hypothetical protein
LSSFGTVVANSSGGFSVTGGHTYAEEGSFSVSVTITDAGGSSSVALAAATVADAALSAAGSTLVAVEGASFGGSVASFTDADPNGVAGDYVATVAWGDGNRSIGTVVANSSGGFTVSSGHAYAEEGNYSVSVAINDVGGSTVVATGSAAVADANLSAQGIALPATRFAAFSGVVATFTDADPGGVASDYIASINWGDGTTSTGVVSAVGAGFAVTGTHAFGEGRFAITTSIADAGGASAVATSTITVDLTPPVTTATVNGRLHHNGWWHTGNPGILTLTATDNLTGVAATYFTINGGAPQLYTGPITLGPGRYVITYWSVDGVGNVETAHTILIKVSHAHDREDRESESDGEPGPDQLTIDATADSARAESEN